MPEGAASATRAAARYAPLASVHAIATRATAIAANSTAIAAAARLAATTVAARATATAALFTTWRGLRHLWWRQWRHTSPIRLRAAAVHTQFRQSVGDDVGCHRGLVADGVDELPAQLEREERQGLCEPLSQ